jgi:hypothetical protein
MSSPSPQQDMEVAVCRSVEALLQYAESLPVDQITACPCPAPTRGQAGEHRMRSLRFGESEQEMVCELQKGPHALQENSENRVSFRGESLSMIRLPQHLIRR